MFKIRFASIRNMDISNGEGVGVALFVQGCNFHCYNCFNKDTWDFNGGKEWTLEVEDKLIELASRPYIKRISILGGEPLADENLDGVLNLVNKIRLLLPNKTIWLYTGYEFDYLFGDIIKWNESELIDNCKRQDILRQCDVVVDGRYVDSLRDISLRWCGSSNQRVIDVKNSIKKGEIILWENK